MKKRILTEAENLKRLSKIVTEGKLSATKVGQMIWMKHKKLFIANQIDKPMVRLSIYEIMEDLPEEDIDIGDIVANVMSDLGIDYDAY